MENNQEKSKTCDCGNCAGGMWGGHRSHKAVMLALVFLSIFLVSKTIAEIKGWGLIGKDIPPQTTIFVSGKGEVLVKPDIANFSFGVEAESLSVAEAQDKAAEAEKKILDFLKENGVSKDDIKVSDYSLYPRYEYRDKFTPVYVQNGLRILAGYNVNESVQVKVRDIANAGKIIGKLGDLGATNVSGLNFTVDKEEDVIKEARAKAIMDARESAEKLAKDLGVSLVRIVSFSENGQYPAPIYYGKVESRAYGIGGDAIATPELPTGTNKITSEVSVTYEIR